MTDLVPAELFEKRILLLRGHKVILDSDLAELYEVEVKQLKRQVRRNLTRFPADFMFELSKKEQESLRRHLGTLEWGDHSKYLSYAKTDGGTGKVRALHLSRQEMAEILGLTVETVSRIMADLRRKGIIDAPRGSIVISARARLQRLAGEPQRASPSRKQSRSRRKDASSQGNRQQRRERNDGQILRLS